MLFHTLYIPDYVVYTLLLQLFIAVVHLTLLKNRPASKQSVDWDTNLINLILYVFIGGPLFEETFFRFN
jgi:membrane protease YdiL (CAAX protease family)